MQNLRTHEPQGTGSLWREDLKFLFRPQQKVFHRLLSDVYRAGSRSGSHEMTVRSDLEWCVMCIVERAMILELVIFLKTDFRVHSPDERGGVGPRERLERRRGPEWVQVVGKHSGPSIRSPHKSPHLIRCKSWNPVTRGMKSYLPHSTLLNRK